MTLTFEKWEDGRWFVVLPDYEGDQEDLEMVGGADKLLDYLTEDNMCVKLIVDDENVHYDWNRLDLVSHDDSGGTYEVSGVDGFDQEIWLCNVVHELYWDHPEVIYFKVKD